MNIVVCLPVETATIASVLPYAEQRNCAECDVRVWISKSGLTVPDLMIVCIPCAAKNVEDEQELRRLPDADEELMLALGETEGSRLIEQLDRMGIHAHEPE